MPSTIYASQIPTPTAGRTWLWSIN
jgi:hypothetical protein